MASTSSLAAAPPPTITIATPSSSSSSSFCTYAFLNAKIPRRNATHNCCSTHKSPPLRKDKHSHEPKPKLEDPAFANIDLITLCEEGKLSEVLELICQDVVAGYNFYLALLNLCENTTSLEWERRVHEFFKRSTFRKDIELHNELIGMYGRCGSMKDASRVFDRMPERYISSWNLVINGYTLNDAGGDGLLVYQQMKQAG